MQPYTLRKGRIRMIDTTAPEFARARELFVQEFGEPASKDVLAVYAPGRSEIAGNHTDHEGGHVIAGAVNVAVYGYAAPNGLDVIRVADEGFPTFQISFDDLSAHEDEKVSSASLMRGMAFKLAETGRTPAGFDFAFVCTVPSGGGLSSSAAVEAAYGRVMEALWPGRDISPVELAQMSQFAENQYFGKPCGLMDQLAVCMGGLAYMDFREAEPKTAKLDFDFDAVGVALCLVDVGCDHSPFTDDYAAVPVEMQQVAHEFGCNRLCEVDEAAFDTRLPELREKLGDRAVLRAIHYWRENDLVDARWKALNDNDIDTFLELTRESGASSGMFLQNVSNGGSFQPAMYALGLAERLLKGRGASRIHGGGFGGSIQCFVPLDMVDAFMQQMNAWLGEGSCRHYTISENGACAETTTWA